MGKETAAYHDTVENQEQSANQSAFSQPTKLPFYLIRLENSFRIPDLTTRVELK